MLTILVEVFSFLIKKSNKQKKTDPISRAWKNILQHYVIFYQKLDQNKKEVFEQKVQHFLMDIKITGINTLVEDIDKVLIAASAVIPIFNFPAWEYVNLHEVLLYPDSFDLEFNQDGNRRNVLGMVGSGGLNNMMVLSKSELRRSFENTHERSNAAIHEFVHLVDKTDGAIDGVPSVIMDQEYILPWLQMIHHEIQKINDDNSDINPYAATDQGEFLAVVSEYFFTQPEHLKENHLHLFEMLEKIFRTKNQN